MSDTTFTVEKEMEFFKDTKENLLSLAQTKVAAGEIDEALKIYEALQKVYKIMDDHLVNTVDAHKRAVEAKNEADRPKNELINSAVKIMGTGAMIGVMCLFEAKGHVFTSKSMSILPKPHI